MELLLDGQHINKSDFHATYKTFTLTQRVEEIRNTNKWDVKSKTIPGKRGMVEYWLEPEEIERIKNSPRMVSNNEQNHKDEQLVEPIENVVEKASVSLKNEDIAYEQTSLLLGGENFKKRW